MLLYRYAKCSALAACIKLTLLVVVGCHTKVSGPACHLVSGRVVDTTGNQFPGGMIEFRCVDGKQFHALGEIARSGTFCAATIIGNRRVRGMVAGKYAVYVSTLMDGRQVSKRYEIEDEIEIRGPCDNLTITVIEPEQVSFVSPLTLEQMQDSLMRAIATVHWKATTQAGQRCVEGTVSGQSHPEQMRLARITDQRNGRFVMEVWLQMQTKPTPAINTPRTEYLLELCQARERQAN